MGLESLDEHVSMVTSVSGALVAGTADSARGTLTMNGNPVFSSAEIDAALRARGDDVQDVAVRDLKRYYSLLPRATPQFSEEEAGLLVDALAGRTIEPEDVRTTWSIVQRAIQRDMLDRRWFVDSVSLISKLRFMEPWQLIALIDAIERYSRLPAEEMEMGEALRAVGLVKEGAKGFKMRGGE